MIQKHDTSAFQSFESPVCAASDTAGSEGRLIIFRPKTVANSFPLSLLPQSRCRSRSRSRAEIICKLRLRGIKLQPPHQRLGREVGREGERKKSALHVRWQSLRNCFESSRRASSPLLNTLAMNFGKANT